MANFCQTGQTGEVFVNGSVVGTYPGIITTEITQKDYWDYVFVGTASAGGCVTWYSVIYRESVDSEPLLAVDFRSGQIGSCNLPVKDVRAKVSFDDGSTYKSTLAVSNTTGIIPDPNNSDHIYPNGGTINWHGNSEQDALPQLFSKTPIILYSLKIYSQGNLVFEKDYTESPTVSVNCSGILVPHDCLNGKCVPASQYGTPGLYPSKDDCQLICGLNPQGLVCMLPQEFSTLKQLIEKARRTSCD